MRHPIVTGALAALVLGFFASTPASAAYPPDPQHPKLYKVEWVYRIKYGFKEEWWVLFQKYQIPILDRAKARGFVLSYEIQKPDFHEGGAARWDYRIIITYPDRDGPYHEGEVTQELYPDTTQMEKDDHRRWEITEDHWDLPIHDVDPHGIGF